MNKIRIIARIDVKNEFAIKGIHLEGLRKVGNPNMLAKKYYGAGIDEIIFMDAVAAYYDRNSLSDIISAACTDIYIPITVGGGIRTLEDIQTALSAGADKVAINTAAIKSPAFITKAAQVFGSQCIICSIEAKKISNGKWDAYTDNGREPAGIDVINWAKDAANLGAGEIMVTSIDKEGTKKSFDIDLNKAVAEAVNIPVIASGGAGNSQHITETLQKTNIDAVALASVLHYNLLEIPSLKSELLHHNIKVRS
jgi:cyclase